MYNNHTTISDNIKTVEDFFKLVTTKDRRRTPVLQSSTVHGVGIVKFSAEDIETTCQMIREQGKLVKTSLSLSKDYYGTGLAKIVRTKSEVIMDSATNPKRKKKSRKNEKNKLRDARSYVHQVLIEPYNKIVEIEDNSWDVHTLAHEASYYTGLTIKEIKSCLEGPTLQFKSNIHPDINPDVGPMEGLNSSMYYVACRGSYSEVHVEDANLESFNIVHFVFDAETPNAIAKIWIIIPEKEEFYKTVVKAKIAINEGRPNNGEHPTCCQFLDRKNCFVTLEFLKENNVMYYIIEQRPGDIVYLKPGVFHQVINLTANCAEAINFASNQWNHGNNMSSVCKCPDCSQLVHIRPNQAIVHVVKSRVIKVYECPILDCPAKFARKDSWGEHLKEKHGIKRPHKCGKCGKDYLSYQNLSNHSCSHNGNENTKSFCELCKKWVARIQRHYNTPKHQEKGKLLKYI